MPHVQHWGLTRDALFAFCTWVGGPGYPYLFSIFLAPQLGVRTQHFYCSPSCCLENTLSCCCYCYLLKSKTLVPWRHLSLASGYLEFKTQVSKVVYVPVFRDLYLWKCFLLLTHLTLRLVCPKLLCRLERGIGWSSCSSDLMVYIPCAHRHALWSNKANRTVQVLFSFEDHICSGSSICFQSENGRQ